MDWKLLETWGIKKNSDYKMICDELEEHQLMLLQMRRSESDPEKREKIIEELKNIDKQLEQAKKERTKKSEDSVVSYSVQLDESTLEDDKRAEMKRKLDDIKKQEEKRRKDEKAKAKAEALSRDNVSSNKDSASIKKMPKSVESMSAHSLPKESAHAGANLGMIPVSDDNQLLERGVVEYNNGNFDSAFVIFYNWAQKGDPEAEYYLSQLFSKGHGTSVDTDKANFWLKKSADHKYIEAQYAYAIALLSNRSGIEPLSKEGMKYLEKAADQDFYPAMRKYIDIVLQGYQELFAIKNAIQYASKLQLLLSDQYEINVYKQKEEQLKNILTEGRKHESSGNILRCIGILSSILLAVGFIYLLGGAHPDEWNKNALLKVFPDAISILIIPFHIYWKLILPELTVNGKFGLELITIAYIGKSIYEAKQKEKIKSIFSTVSKCIILSIIIWHLLLAFRLEKKSPVEGVIYYVCALIVCHVFAFIISKMILSIGNAKTVTKKVLLLMVFTAILVCVNLFSSKVPAFNEVVRQREISEVKTNGNAVVEDKNTKAISMELSNDDLSACRIINISSINADSVLVSSKGKRHEAGYMVDGDIATSWQEGEEGAGEGVSFTAIFEDRVKVDYVVIYNGNHKSKKLYAYNNRIHSLNIIVDGQIANVELADTMNPQIIRLEGDETVSEMKFEIISVYNGSKYNDTCVAEVQFFCK